MGGPRAPPIQFEPYLMPSHEKYELGGVMCVPDVWNKCDCLESSRRVKRRGSGAWTPVGVVIEGRVRHGAGWDALTEAQWVL